MLINIQHLISTGVSWSKANIKGQPVGLITVKSFNSNTRDDVMHALEELHKYVTD
jgi:C-terminal processing protease CtpA/Prc